VFVHGHQVVLLPPPNEQPTIRSRGAQFNVPKPPAPLAEPPLSWEEVRRRARTAASIPALVENGRPTTQHPWRRAIAANVLQARVRKEDTSNPPPTNPSALP
jgi:hypothetical protein